MIPALLTPLHTFISNPFTSKSSFDIRWWVNWEIIFPIQALFVSLYVTIYTIYNDLCIYLMLYFFPNCVCVPNIGHKVDGQEIFVGWLGIPKVKLSNCQSLSHPVFCSGYYTTSYFLFSRKSFPILKIVFLASISTFPNHSCTCKNTGFFVSFLSSLSWNCSQKNLSSPGLPALISFGQDLQMAFQY